MAKRWERFKTLFNDVSGIPSDILLDLPRISVIGQLHVYIENHRGVYSFNEKELQLKLTKGLLSITGENFVLKTLYSDEILLEGLIKNLAFQTHADE